MRANMCTIIFCLEWTAPNFALSHFRNTDKMSISIYFDNENTPNYENLIWTLENYWQNFCGQQMCSKVFIAKTFHGACI